MEQVVTKKWEFHNPVADKKWFETETQKLKDNLVPTGHEQWDTCFGGMYRGGLHLICASTGVGKTRYLIAMAKHLSRKGLKVLFISTEQDSIQLYNDYGLKDSNMWLVYSDKKVLDILNSLEQEQFDAVFYDYIGGEVVYANRAVGEDTDWKIMRATANELADIAVKKHMVIFSAVQGKDALNDYTDFKDIPNTPKNVAFATSIIDKAHFAAYLLKDGLGGCVLIPMKRRGRELMRGDEIYHTDIDWGNCKFYKMES